MTSHRFGARQTWLQFWVCPILAIGLQSHYLTSLSLSFLISKKEIVTFPNKVTGRFYELR